MIFHFFNFFYCYCCKYFHFLEDNLLCNRDLQNLHQLMFIFFIHFSTYQVVTNIQNIMNIKKVYTDRVTCLIHGAEIYTNKAMYMLGGSQ